MEVLLASQMCWSDGVVVGVGVGVSLPGHPPTSDGMSAARGESGVKTGQDQVELRRGGEIKVFGEPLT